MKVYVDNRVMVKSSLDGKYALRPYEVLTAKIAKGTHGGCETLKLLLAAKGKDIPSRAHVDLFDEAAESFISDQGLDESGIGRLVGREISGVLQTDKNFIAGVALNQ